MEEGNKTKKMLLKRVKEISKSTDEMQESYKFDFDGKSGAKIIRYFRDRKRL